MYLAGKCDPPHGWLFGLPFLDYRSDNENYFTEEMHLIELKKCGVITNSLLALQKSLKYSTESRSPSYMKSFRLLWVWLATTTGSFVHSSCRGCEHTLSLGILIILRKSTYYQPSKFTEIVLEGRQYVSNPHNLLWKNCVVSVYDTGLFLSSATKQCMSFLHSNENPLLQTEAYGHHYNALSK